MHINDGDVIRQKMDEFAHLVYSETRSFPQNELFGITSQLRRAALSVILNYVEGFARENRKVFNNFLSISYGSLKESLYLLNFSCKEGLILEQNYKKCSLLGHEIAKMLWKLRHTLQK